MTYFDPKEEVIDLKLTPYGEYLLSIGKLSPSFYAFFDDDVTYDLSGSGVSTELQSQIEPRIQEQTPKIRVQTSFVSREKDFVNKKAEIDSLLGGLQQNGAALDETSLQIEKQIFELLKPQVDKKTETFLQPIGKFNPNSQKARAWNVSFLKAPLSASLDYLHLSGTFDNGHHVNIPQLDCNIQYEIERNSGPYNQTYEDDSTSLNVDDIDPDNKMTIFYADGSTITLEEDSIILRVEESNTNFQLENFDIELFEILTVEDSESPQGNKEYLKPIPFQERVSGLKDLEYSVESFFDLQLDEEIPERVICPLINKSFKKHIFETKIFNCETAGADMAPQDFYADVDDTKDVCE